MKKTFVDNFERLLIDIIYFHLADDSMILTITISVPVSIIIVITIISISLYIYIRRGRIEKAEELIQLMHRNEIIE